MASPQWTIEEIRQLVDMMSNNGVVEMDLNDHDFRLRLRKAEAFTNQAPAVSTTNSLPAPATSGVSQNLLPSSVQQSPSATQVMNVLPQVLAAAIPAAEANLTPIKSPIVGTFYRAPSPDSEAFVQEGQFVDKDSVVCIIEAMKIMNEVKARVRGKIVRILLDNGEPVEYNQDLFLVDTNS